MARGTVAELFDHAARLLRGGRLDEAQRACRAVLKKDARHHRAHHLLAIVEFQRGELEKAVTLFDRCLRYEPDYPPALNDRGVALCSLGRREDALASYDRALALDPTNAEALNNRGTVLNLLGRDEEALMTLDQAIGLRPGYVDALSNRGLTLHKLRRYEEALASFDRALAISSASFQALLNRGHALTALDRHEEALASYDQALALQPHDPDALLHRAGALTQLNRVDDATAAYQRLLAAYPDHAEARLALCMAQLPPLYMSEAEIVERRANYESHLAALVDYVERRGTDGDLAAAFGRIQPFFLAYQGRNDRAPQSSYGSLFCHVIAAQFPPATLPGPPAADEPVKVGIVSAFFREHSNWKIPIKGWLGRLDRKRFRLFGYHTGSRCDGETQAAAALCERFVQGPLPLADWRAAILADAPHVLIHPEVGMDRVSAQLAAQRLAPVQCNSWGHPETSGFPTLDYVLTSDLMEPPDAQDHYTERVIRLPNLSIYYEPAAAIAPGIDRDALGLRPHATAFWCGQALFKYLPQYDEVFARIAREVPDSQFVFVEAYGARRITELFRQRLAAVFAACGADAGRRCVFLPRMTMSRFAAAIGACDVILDSIGWSGCNSTLESLPHGLPVVTMPGPFMRGRHTAAILTMMGVTDTIAATLDDYVAIAVRLAKDAQWRADLKARISQNTQSVYRDTACISALEDFLDRVGRGRLPA
jgi:predicted O-linked N-acetylglucosamine transferase (SPINDLY family)